MRPNLVLMLSFLIFLVGFFSSQVALTGQTIRTDSYSSLTNEELTLYSDLTVEDCRVLARDVSYAQRSGSLDRVPLEAGQGDPLTKTQYQLQARGEDLDGNGVLDRRDSGMCYNIVNQRGPYATIEFKKRPATVMSTCKELGAKKCIDDALVICSVDALGDFSWVIETRAGKAQECREGFLDREAMIESLVITKPWTYRFSTESWIDRLSQ